MDINQIAEVNESFIGKEKPRAHGTSYLENVRRKTKNQPWMEIRRTQPGLSQLHVG